MESTKIVDFLDDLSRNNNREWFNEHKNRYKLAREDFDSFINELIPLLKKMDAQIDVLSAKECTFRIYRDVRFSKNKDPYKTNFGAFIAKGGRKSGNAGYYVHIEPGRSFLGGGNYMPSSGVLKAIRNEILYNVDEFIDIVNHKDFSHYFGHLEGEKLIRPPKGFPKDFKNIELLKFKSYVVLHPLDDRTVTSKDFMKYVIPVFKAMKPLNHFLNRALD